MARALSETPAVNGTDSEAQRRTFWPLTLGCMGVVYGDIGTSPLYAFRVALDAAGGSQGDLSRATVIGVLSLILWALFLVVTAKYVLILLRADNKGEGGTLSLMALAQRALKSRRAQSVVVVLGMIAASLFYGDALLTPAISVLSAICTSPAKPSVINHSVITGPKNLATWAVPRDCTENSAIRISTVTGTT